MGRIIVFTGKGGVGKSSVAASHAVKAAHEGIRTLIVSTDMAHNLGDIFMIHMGNEPVSVFENLDALEIDPDFEMNKRYANILAAFDAVMNTGSDNNDEAENIVAFPGIEELFALIRINDIYESGQYDLIIVDCAPTGETLALLKYPEVMSWYMEKMFPIGKKALRLLRPVSKAIFKLELPDQEAVNDIEKLYMMLINLQKLLKNREVTSIRIVTIPEKMVVDESKRNYMYMNLYNFNVDAVYINRLLPEDAANEFFSVWKTTQAKYTKELEYAFSHLPVYKIKWYETDINGVAGLQRVIDDSLDDKDIFSVRISEENEVYEKTADGYSLSVKMPFADKKEFDLYQSCTDVIIKTGSFKRSIPLPQTLTGCTISGAKFENSVLKVSFIKEG
ncbi:MAG: ArsA family ATPase [Oscillospiraceae bacterium]|nr:ArsA family ATPase [Oscillospiraceae bacterium]